MKEFLVPFYFDQIEYRDIDSLVQAMSHNWKEAKECIYNESLINYFKQENPEIAKYLSNILENTSKYLVIDELNDKKDIGTFIAINMLGYNLKSYYWKGKEYHSLEEFSNCILTDNTVCNLFMNYAISLIVKTKNASDTKLVETIRKIEDFTIKEGIEGAYRFKYLISNNQDIVINGVSYKDVDDIIEKITENDSSLYIFLDEIVNSPSFRARVWKEGNGALFKEFDFSNIRSILEKTSIELKFLEKITKTKKDKIKKLALLKGNYSYIFWLVKHLNHYEYRGNIAERVREKFQNKKFNFNEDIDSIENQLEDLKSYYDEFIKLVIKNPYDISYGVLEKEDLEDCIIPLTIDAMFLGYIDKTSVTVAYIKSIENIDNVKKYLNNLEQLEGQATSKFDSYEREFKTQKNNFVKNYGDDSSSMEFSLIIKLVVLALIFIISLVFVNVKKIENLTINVIDKVIIKTAEYPNEKLNSYLYELKQACIDDMQETVKTKVDESEALNMEFIPEERNMEISDGNFNPFGSTEEGSQNTEKTSSTLPFGEYFVLIIKAFCFSLKVIILYPLFLILKELFKNNNKASNNDIKKINILEEQNKKINSNYDKRKDGIDYKIIEGEIVDLPLNEITLKTDIVKEITNLNISKNKSEFSGSEIIYKILSLVIAVFFASIFALIVLPLTKVVIDKTFVFIIIESIIFALMVFLNFRYISKKATRFDYFDWFMQILYVISRIIIFIIVAGFVGSKISRIL